MNTSSPRFAFAGSMASYALLLLLSPLTARAAVTTDSLGWTVITPSTDSLIVYVSSAGNDANNGLTPTTAKATLAGANALVRDGYPDHIRFRRGDTFVENFALYGDHRWKNGRSASEPIVMEAYGTTGARPIIKFTGKFGTSDLAFIDHNGQVRNYQAFIGLDLYKSNSDPASPDYNGSNCYAAFRLVGGGDHITVEDCRLRFSCAIAQNYTTSTVNYFYTNFFFLRNIVTDAWVNSSYVGDYRIQGLYVAGVNGYTIEENVFDHNGWSEVVANAGANQYNHNVYVQSNNFAGGRMRGNVFARGAAHGLQARSGGIVERNLFVLNAIGFNTGYTDTPADPNVLTFANTAVDNVVLNGRNMGADTNWPRTGAVWGIWKQASIPNVTIDNNIVANRVAVASNQAMPGVTTLLSNIIYQWETARDMTNAAWPHPGDDLGDFYASIGGTNSTTDYLDSLRNRPIHSLPWNLTAYSAINYIRAGFNKAAVTGLFNYAGTNLLSFGDFQPDIATTLDDMPATYTLGTGPLNKWQARVGTGGGQASTLISSAGDNYLDAGSGNTPGTFQVILYPGAGSKVLTYTYRGPSVVKIFTGVAGNTIAKFTGVNTLTLVQSFTDTNQAAWTAASHTVTLSGSPTYVVVQLLNGAFDNISLASP